MAASGVFRDRAELSPGRPTLLVGFSSAPKGQTPQGAAGHKVIATSRNPSKTPDFVPLIKTNGGKWLEFDVNDPTSPRFVDNLEQAGIEIDVLIDNAGYSIFAPVESTTEEELRA
ncbi:MAG: hypothetical protein Q9199_001187 [Rusavskia elegans]